jgi:hypothetical protein
MQHFVRSSNEYREFWHIGPAQYVEHRGSNPMEMTWDHSYPLPGDLYQGFNRGRIAISPEEERLGTRDLPRQLVKVAIKIANLCLTYMRNTLNCWNAPHPHFRLALWKAIP